jgi:hypothetical protein
MSVQMPHNESVPCWFYCINGSEFGPFTPKMMTDWMRVSWFLPVSRCSTGKGREGKA